MEHSKGDWDVKIWEYADGVIGTKVMVQNKEHAIAEAIQSYYPQEKLEYAREQAEANARLIAAAPDLLAACEVALKDTIAGELVSQLILEQAIAKAKGE